MDNYLKLELKLNQNKHVGCRGRFRSYLVVLLNFRFILIFQISSVSYNYGNLTYKFICLVYFLFMLSSIINF